MISNLNYHSLPSTAPRTLTLEESDGCVRVIFAAPPKWMYVLPIVGGITAGIVKIVMAALFISLMWRLTHVGGTPPPEIVAFGRRFVTNILISMGIAVSWWWAMAAYQWWMYRRWGRVPRILTATADGLVLSSLGMWRMRERKWPASDITNVEIRRVRWNLNRRRPLFLLLISRRRGRRLRFRLSSPDCQLPGRIGERIAAAIGCSFAPPPSSLSRNDTESPRDPTGSICD